MSDNFSVLRKIDLADASIQLRAYKGAQGLRGAHRQSVYTIGLTERCQHVQARYPGRAGSETFADLGVISARPPEVLWEYISPRPTADVVLCSIERERFQQVASLSGDWSDAALSRSLDIHCPFLTESLRLLRREMLAPTTIVPHYVDCILDAIIVRVAKYLEDAGGPGEDAAKLTRAQLAHIERWLLDLWDDYPRINDLAGSIGITKRCLQDRFKRTTGETLTAFIARIQIEKAASLLRTTDLAIKEISYRLGFAHSPNFSIAFRRQTGVSPARFRQTH